jgi:hypothetical protein
MKVATDLERKIKLATEEKVQSASVDQKNKQIAITRPEDIKEIAEILQNTGVLQGKTVGIEQTTRIIVNGEEE